MDTDSRTDLAISPRCHAGIGIVTIPPTTLGETGGDEVPMSWLGETTPAARGRPDGGLVGAVKVGCLLRGLVSHPPGATRRFPR